jgi:hypothetical protein
MKHDLPSESDWKRFRTIVPDLRERYLRKRNSELSAILRDEALNATDQFWTASERIDEIGKILKSCLDGHSRSTMVSYLMMMQRHQMLREEDLDGFSEGVRERLAGIQQILSQSVSFNAPTKVISSRDREG